jgi:superfamily II DNA/RNA helicase
LTQQYLFIPAKWKDCYLAYVLDEFKGQSAIIFVATCNNALRLTLLLRTLGFGAVCLHGQMTQPKRLGALNKFKSGVRNILVATDVASRGLDIPSVDMVLNFDIPSHGKDYIHRYPIVGLLSLIVCLVALEEQLAQARLADRSPSSPNMMWRRTNDLNLSLDEHCLL